MYIKQKNLHAKCRACGNDQILDSTHRAGAQLMKNLPKNMSEIDATAASAGVAADTKKLKAGVEEEKAEESKKTKKKKEENLDKLDDEVLALDSEEICK